MRPSRLSLMLLFSLPASVLAQQEPGAAVLAGLPVANDARPAARTWLFNEDAQLPAAKHGVVLSRLTWSSQATGAARPFAGDLGSPGAMLEVGGELGLGASLSLQAIGVRGAAYQTDSAATGAQLGFRWAPLASSWPSTRVVLGAGYLRELSGVDGAWGNIAIEQDLGRARLAFSVRGDHPFGQRRDGIDMMVTAGADVQVSPFVRAGVEYVGQDLEGIAEPDAEGGASHLVGVVVGVRLLTEHLTLIGGPALGLGGSAARGLGRVAVALAF